jgi:hypothetical protein
MFIIRLQGLRLYFLLRANKIQLLKFTGLVTVGTPNGVCQPETKPSRLMQ